MKKIAIITSLLAFVALIASTASAKDVEPTENSCHTYCGGNPFRCTTCCVYGNQTVCT